MGLIGSFFDPVDKWVELLSTSFFISPYSYHNVLIKYGFLVKDTPVLSLSKIPYLIKLTFDFPAGGNQTHTFVMNTQDVCVTKLRQSSSFPSFIISGKHTFTGIKDAAVFEFKSTNFPGRSHEMRRSQ